MALGRSGDEGPGHGSHPVDLFLAALEALPEDLYPEALVPVAGRHVNGVAAFPAGRGLYAECGWDHSVPPPFPFGGLMLVGNHLDAEDSYLVKIESGEAHGDPCPGARRMRFWSMLYALLDLAGVDRSMIFITNVHPALFRGDVPTGLVASNPEWAAVCGLLLLEQIEVMRPTAIAAMGAPAQDFVGQLLDVNWSTVPDSSDIEVDGHRTSVLAVRHPSASQSHQSRQETADLLRQALGRSQ